MRSASLRGLVGLVSCGLLGVGCSGEGDSSGADPYEGGILASAQRTPDGEPTPNSAASSALALGWVAEARPVTTTDEQTHLVLELLAQNVSASAQRIVALDVFGVGQRRPLLRLTGEELAQAILPIEPPADAEATPADLAAGTNSFVYVDVALGRTERLPAQLRAVLRLASGEVSVAPAVAVVRERPVVLSPPLRGEGLVDVGGCCRGEHGRAVLQNEAGFFDAQRYAIDFVRAQGTESFAGDPSDNESYFIFGDDVLAAAEGRIVAVRNTIPENDPTQPLPEFDVDGLPGNYVVQDLGGGRFALYAHLQTGSVRVMPGELVSRGQVLGLVGNTGNSMEPHLHFHVMAGPSPLASNGLPYVFDDFRLQGRVDVSGDEAVIVPTEGREQRRRRLPMDLDIVAFDD